MTTQATWLDGTTLAAYRKAISLDNEADMVVKAKTIRVLCAMAAKLSAIEREVMSTPQECDVIADLETWGD